MKVLLLVLRVLYYVYFWIVKGIVYNKDEGNMVKNFENLEICRDEDLFWIFGERLLKL